MFGSRSNVFLVHGVVWRSFNLIFYVLIIVFCIDRVHWMIQFSSIITIFFESVLKTVVLDNFFVKTMIVFSEFFNEYKVQKKRIDLKSNIFLAMWK